MMGMADLGSNGLGVMGRPPQNEPSPCDQQADLVNLDDLSSEESFGMGYSAGKESWDSQKGTVSGEDCCTAVLALIECCSCEETKQKLRAVCEDIIDGKSSYHGGWS